MPRNLVISCSEEWVLKKPNCLRWKMRQSWQCFLKFCLGVQLTSDSWKKSVLLEMPVKWSWAHYGWTSEHGFNPTLQDNAPYERWAQKLAALLIGYDRFMDEIIWHGVRNNNGQISWPTMFPSVLHFQMALSSTGEEPARITKPFSTRKTTRKNTQECNPPQPFPQHFIHFHH